MGYFRKKTKKRGGWKWEEWGGWKWEEWVGGVEEMEFPGISKK